MIIVLDLIGNKFFWYCLISYFPFSIYIININCHNTKMNTETISKLNFVDLAGSERIMKSKAEGERKKEACFINQSLTTLGKVVNAIATKSIHIPYRESKLTHLLKDSLGGNSKCLFVIQISPAINDISESISTLNFGIRVSKTEKGKASINSNCGSNNSTNIMTTGPSSHNSSIDITSNVKTISKIENGINLAKKPLNQDKNVKNTSEKGIGSTSKIVSARFYNENKENFDYMLEKSTEDSSTAKNFWSQSIDNSSNSSDITSTIESLHVLLDKTNVALKNKKYG